MSPVILILLFLIFLGALPAWPGIRKWSYLPSAALGLVVLAMLALLLIALI